VVAELKIQHHLKQISYKDGGTFLSSTFVSVEVALNFTFRFFLIARDFTQNCFKFIALVLIPSPWQQT
jgi:hypothetical protein